VATQPDKNAAAASRFTALDAVRLSFGYIYFHFGFLKFFPDLSPAEILASYTVMNVSGFLFDASDALWWLGLLECVIGLGFLFKFCMRLTGVLFLFHMIGTFLPLFLLPEFGFKFVPFAPSIEGQYILKNLVLLTAGWAVLEPHFRRQPRTASPPPAQASPESPAS